MRRAFLAASAVAALLAPAAACADSITTASAPLNLQTNGLYSDGDGLMSPVGAFNQSLGTLTDTTLTFSGSFTPGLQLQTDPHLPPGQTYPTSVPVTLTGEVGIYGPGYPMVTLPAETVSAVHIPNGNPYGGITDSYIAIGTAQPVTVSDDFGADPSPYAVGLSA